MFAVFYNQIRFFLGLWGSPPWGQPPGTRSKVVGGQAEEAGGNSETKAGRKDPKNEGGTGEEKQRSSS